MLKRLANAVFVVGYHTAARVSDALSGDRDARKSDGESRRAVAQDRWNDRFESDPPRGYRGQGDEE